MSSKDAAITNCLYATIIGFLLPFFLAGAGGDAQLAEAAIGTLIDAYSPNSPTELDLAGRIIGFSIAAMDNLRLSAGPDLSDAKLLRYRSNAATLGRGSIQARKMLEAVQAGEVVKQEIPRPSVAAAPPAPKPVRPVNVAAAALPMKSAKLPDGMFGMAVDFEGMKREARIMMEAFSKSGAAEAALLMTPDPAAMAGAAARAAVRSAMG